jgi:hypothetical protein
MSTATYQDPIQQYITQHPDADPKALLDVLLQQTSRLREEKELLQEQYRDNAQVTLDEGGDFKPTNLAGLWSLGKMYARSSMVPEHYRNKIEDCAIGAQMALRCGVNILTFLQSSYIVHGKPGIESKLAIAMLNSSGQIKGRVRFRLAGEGKSRQCTAYAIDAESGETIEQTVTWEMVEAEGWHKPKGSQVSKWMTMPDLMFQYRSAMFLIRVFFPDVLMGMQSVEELRDVNDLDDAPPAPVPANSLAELTERLSGNGNGKAKTNVIAAEATLEHDMGKSDDEAANAPPQEASAEKPAEAAKTAETGAEAPSGDAGDDSFLITKAEADDRFRDPKRKRDIGQAEEEYRVKCKTEAGRDEISNIARVARLNWDAKTEAAAK